MERIDCLIVGGGVVGLAIAREMARTGREVIIAEQEDHFGMATSSRNSEVVHAGIYYPAGSLKAVHCVAGRDRLYRYCEDHGVPFRKCGKLIVATSDDEIGALNQIRNSAHVNGVGDVDWAVLDAVKEKYPGLKIAAALNSPSTGIVDSYQFMLALLGDAESDGAMIAYRAEVSNVVATGAGFEVSLARGERSQFLAATLINAAGLGAVALAQRIAGLDACHIPDSYLAKGSYFSLVGKSPFSTLIYPVPVPGALGIHLTVDMGGQVRFGPDIEWVDQHDYAVDPHRATAFYRSIRRYWPDLPDNALQPAYAGIRPKLHMAHEGAADFRIDGEARHGIPNLLNLFGIESPGLTASLSIARVVRQILSAA